MANQMATLAMMSRDLDSLKDQVCPGPMAGARTGEWAVTTHDSASGLLQVAVTATHTSDPTNWTRRLELHLTDRPSWQTERSRPTTKIFTYLTVMPNQLSHAWRHRTS